MCKDNWTDSVLLSRCPTLASECEEFIMLPQNVTHHPVIAILHMGGSGPLQGHRLGGTLLWWPAKVPSLPRLPAATSVGC